MRIGVIGAGAVGGAIAALLARAGHEVEVTARGENLDAIRKNGIRLSGGWGEFVASVDAGEELERPPELAFVATKAQDARRAILANLRMLGGIPVAVVQNGLDSVATAAPLLPHADVLGVLALYASSLTAPGTVRITTPGPTFLGGGGDIPARFVASILDPVMPTTVANNFVGAQWSKLIVNQVNALPAITGLSVQEVIGLPALRRVMTLSMRENVRVGIAAGIRFAPVQGLTDRRLRLFARAPLAFADSLPKLMSRRMGAVPNPGSTLQSIRRGALTEIDYLNGAVVAAARALGMPVPVNTGIVGLVHEVEKSHEFLAPDEVVARVGRPTER